MDRLNAWTDGSCDGQYAIGGWAVVLSDGRELSGVATPATPASIEFEAICQALDVLSDHPCPGAIYSDSHDVLNVIARGREPGDLETQLFRYLSNPAWRRVCLHRIQAKGKSAEHARANELSRYVMRQERRRILCEFGDQAGGLATLADVWPSR